MIYIHPILKSIRSFYGPVLDHSRFVMVYDQLEEIAQHLFIGLSSQNEALYNELNNYHPDFIGKSKEELQKLKYSINDCRDTIAYEYGFSNWEEVQDLSEELIDHNFEAVVNLFLAGEIEKFRVILEEHPQLVNQRSQYGHKSTILHYAASNGIELWRQVVPHNLAEMVKILLDNGADIDAKMKVYGGQFSVRELLDTSAHPREAGIYNLVKNTLDSHNRKRNHV